MLCTSRKSAGFWNPSYRILNCLDNILKEKLTTPRTLEDIANELSRSSGSLNSSVASVISADSSEPSESGHSSNGGINLH